MHLAPCTFQLVSTSGNRTHLALVHNPPVGVHGPDLAVGVHAVGHGGREQPEALAAAQQDVQVVMVVMVQPAGRSWKRTGNLVTCTLAGTF